MRLLHFTPLFFLLFAPVLTWGQVNGKYYFERNDDVVVSESGSQLDFPWAGGMNSIQVSRIDLDQDGTEDLFIFDRTGNTILTFLWDLTLNKWVFAPEYVDQFPTLNYWTLLRDYNCDGKKDIFSYVSGGIGVWKNVSTSGGLSFEYVSDPYVYSSLLGGTVANLYVSKVDVPDINDVDGDGDLDVLTFGIIGSRMEYHQNLSMELGYGCDSLKYEVANTCWGHFLETGFGTNKCELFDTCTSNVANPKGAKHAGSTVLSLDLNGDAVRDLLLGDVSFNNIVALYNDSKGVNMNTSMMSQDTAFPNGTLPVDLQIFPASFYEDVDMDGTKDLIFSPGSDNETENFESAWFYKNYGSDNSPVFAHIQSDWFQEKMIETGESAFPVLFDYDNDGLQDLFVGNFGYFDLSVPDHYYSQISQYHNVGSSALPAFELVTKDFANISSLGMGKGLNPTFGDIDNDGDVDMLVGDYDGFLQLFVNSSNSMGSMNLTISGTQLMDDNATVIDVGYAAKPVLFDIDSDNDLDLIVGESLGTLNYYENVGSAAVYSFRLQNETLGGVNVSEWWTNIGNSSPVLFKDNQSEIHLFVGSQRGVIFHYTDISSNLSGTFTTNDTLVSYINFGLNASPTLGMLNADTLPDIIVGNERGGVSLFFGSADASIGITELASENKVQVYPNPTNGALFVKSNEQIEYLMLLDLSGRILLTERETFLNVENLPAGIYLLSVHFMDGTASFHQVIKE